MQEGIKKFVNIDEITEAEPFKSLYPVKEDTLERIKLDMEENGFDEDKPLNVWGRERELILIDGYTRLRAAKESGISEVWIRERAYADENEALSEAIKQQINRRNLDGAELLASIRLIKNSDIYDTLKGNKNAAIGEMLGKSEKTIERANYVENNATDEEKKKIENDEASINQTFNEIKKREKLINDKATKEQKKRLENGEATAEEICDEIKESEKGEGIDFPDDISDALEDNEGNPSAVFIKEREYKTDRISEEEDKERTRERREAFQKGFSEGFEKALVFVLSETLKGRTPKEIYDDERISDLSPSVISSFELPEEAREAVSDL